MLLLPIHQKVKRVTEFSPYQKLKSQTKLCIAMSIIWILYSEVKSKDPNQPVWFEPLAWVISLDITVINLITAHAPISAQSSYLVVFSLQPVYFSLLLYENICCWYSFELPQQVEAIQMSTNNICFYKEKQKKYCVSLNMHLMKFSAALS